MTLSNEKSGLIISRPKRSGAWKPVQCRHTASRFDQLESDLLESLLDAVDSTSEALGELVAGTAVVTETTSQTAAGT